MEQSAVEQAGNLIAVKHFEIGDKLSAFLCCEASFLVACFITILPLHNYSIAQLPLSNCLLQLIVQNDLSSNEKLMRCGGFHQTLWKRSNNIIFNIVCFFSLPVFGGKRN